MMQSQHSSQVREAIITLRAKGFLHEKIEKSIKNAGLGPISKGTVCYNVKKYEYQYPRIPKNYPRITQELPKNYPRIPKNTQELPKNYPRIPKNYPRIPKKY
jgi:hypothetical protein